MCRELLQRSIDALSVALLVAAVASLYCCAAPRDGGELSSVQGVEGIVWLQPDYDHSDMMLVSNPPDLSPRRIPGATVYLLTYPKDTLTNSDILAVTESDSTGRYQLQASAGTYYLAVRTGNIQTTIIGGTRDVTIRLIPEVMGLAIVEIRANEFTEHSFEIFEMVPQ